LRFDVKHFCPQPIAVRRDATATRLQLRNESVVLNADFLGQLALRKAPLLTQRAQPFSRLLSEAFNIMRGPMLGVTIHRALLRKKMEEAVR
jgi:hypothetical protein